MCVCVCVCVGGGGGGGGGGVQVGVGGRVKKGKYESSLFGYYNQVKLVFLRSYE